MNFLYLAGCNVNPKNMVDLLRLALALQVSSLKHMVCDALYKIDDLFSVDEIVVLYRLAEKCEEERLIEKYIKSINENDTLVIVCEQWLFLTRERPDLVLKVFYERKP